ncbi:NAD(P)H-quinone oxidoreductase [Devosia sp. 1566]|uniref:NAD(P)H-quinone oxidoreductase n=1 Tax=Devosia sp. 1566 TaxID=2499144 RepID=UPI000FD80753|nr:NAD(P)H-quinone oxidoreductase [Devosia sp. 1566]
MTIPATMTAIAITEPGGPEMLAPIQMPLPACGNGDVLIRVAAAGVNGPDLAQRRGVYDPPPGASPLLGLEVAGEIAALGADVSGWQVGDRVMALTNGGGYAQYVAVPAGQVLPVPNGWSLPEAAALPETWFTVTQTLVMRSGLEAGMSVLVHGAAGGIGGAAVAISAILGARPIGVVSSPEKAAYAEKLGAVATIDRMRDDIAERALALTEGRGVDRVVDLLGGAMAAVSIAASARGGHIVQIATLAGSSAKISLGTLMAKQLTISGSTLRPQSAATKAAIAARIRADLLPALERPGFVRPALTTFRLEEAAEAHQAMEQRAHAGKIVLLTAFGAGEAQL